MLQLVLDVNQFRNLQAALGAYYDYGSGNGTGSPPPEYVTQLPSMQFVQDVTIGEVCLINLWFFAFLINLTFIFSYVCVLSRKVYLS